MPRRISNDDLQELKEWMQQLDVSFKNLHRDFSDALPVANIIKKLYPKLIDLHNYPPRNNTQLKLNNWETLNQKVLIKLGLHQSKSMLDKLSKGMPGAIEALLYDIMLMDRAQKSKGDQRDDEQEQLWTENDDVMTVTVSKKVGDALVQVPQKMILYSIYEQVHRECLAKEQFITQAQQKITHLENVIKLKAERIDDLCAQLARVSPPNSPSLPVKVNSIQPSVLQAATFHLPLKTSTVQSPALQISHSPVTAKVNSVQSPALVLQFSSSEGTMRAKTSQLASLKAKQPAPPVSTERKK